MPNATSTKSVSFLFSPSKKLGFTRKKPSSPTKSLEETQTGNTANLKLVSRKVSSTTEILLDSLAKDLDISSEWTTKLNSNINASNENGNTILMLAVEQGKSVNTLLELINAGVNWNTKNAKGQDTLHIAASCGNLKATNLLVSLGAKVDTVDGYGRTVLHAAINSTCKENFSKIFDILISNGSDINCVDGQGLNLVHLAIRQGKSLSEIQRIINLGCTNWQLKSGDGKSVLHYSVRAGNPQILTYFLEQGVASNEPDLFGRLPIHELIYTKTAFFEILHILVKYGSDLNAVDNFGNDLISLSICRGVSVENIKELVRLGANWKAKNKEGMTPLHFAMRTGTCQLVDYLLKLGANAGQPDCGGRTPLDELICKNENDLRKMQNVLLSHAPESNA